MEPNQDFGRLTTIEPIGKGKFWLCKCKCGKITKASRWHLEKHRRTSCGCRLTDKPARLTCTQCETEKPLEEFYKRKKHPDRLHMQVCKSCFSERARRKIAKQLDLIYSHYGRRCACPHCTETNEYFLTIDHINGDGAEHRRQLGGSGHKLYKWIIDNDYPNTIQLLCWNCNCGKNKYGVCPHTFIAASDFAHAHEPT